MDEAMADTSRTSARRTVAAAGILMVGLLAGCGPRTTTDPQQLPVAFVGEERLTLSDLEAYFEANLLETDVEVEPQEQTAVWSRLFDAFVEERLLLTEAERRALPVDEREVALYLDGIMEDPEGEAERRRLELEARRRLMIKKLQESALLALPALRDEEVRDHAARHRDRLAPERGLELRALMLESMERAEKVYKEIRRRRITFAEAVVRYEKTPGQGLPMRVAWDGLSAEVRTALGDLKSGQISRPMEVNGNIYIFKVESWLKSREEAADELSRRARLELERLRRQEAHDTLLGEIREQTPVRLILRNLPFNYVPAATG
jgi:parvulin-like peptidyl-prolyl isomerase